MVLGGVVPAKTVPPINKEAIRKVVAVLSVLSGFLGIIMMIAHLEFYGKAYYDLDLH